MASKGGDGAAWGSTADSTGGAGAPPPPLGSPQLASWVEAAVKAAKASAVAKGRHVSFEAVLAAVHAQHGRGAPGAGAGTDAAQQQCPSALQEAPSMRALLSLDRRLAAFISAYIHSRWAGVPAVAFDPVVPGPGTRLLPPSQSGPPQACIWAFADADQAHHHHYSRLAVTLVSLCIGPQAHQDPVGAGAADRA